MKITALGVGSAFNLKDYQSNFLAHYDDLVTLPEETKAKMWLYHYQPNPEQDAEADGFAGFIKKSQVFELSKL